MTLVLVGIGCFALGCVIGATYVIVGVARLENMWLDRISDGVSYIDLWLSHPEHGDTPAVHRKLKSLRALIAGDESFFENRE